MKVTFTPFPISVLILLLIVKSQLARQEWKCQAGMVEPAKQTRQLPVMIQKKKNLPKDIWISKRITSLYGMSQVHSLFRGLMTLAPPQLS